MNVATPRPWHVYLPDSCFCQCLTHIPGLAVTVCIIVLQDFPDLEQALAALLAEQLDQRQDTPVAARVRTGAAAGTAATELLHESTAGAGGHGASMEEEESAGIAEHAELSAGIRKHAGASASKIAPLPTASGDSLATHTRGDTGAVSPPAAAEGAAAAALMRSSGFGPQSDARPPSLDLWGAASHSGGGALAAQGFVRSSGKSSAEPRGNAAGAHASGAGADALTDEHLGAGATTRTFKVACVLGILTKDHVYRVLCAQPADEVRVRRRGDVRQPTCQQCQPSRSTVEGT